MTSTMQFPTHVIGLMSGTSADGVDAALLFTDGKAIAEHRAAFFLPYEESLRQQVFACMKGVGDEKKTEHAITEAHARAVANLLKNNLNVSRETVALIGFHGQTILHKPEQGITKQLGDGAMLAGLTGISIVNDFRNNDVKHGGQGAPFAPLYHAALAHDLEKPLMVVNIGGVANITWLGLQANDILAFDCGPGNALIDDWMHTHTGNRRDENGQAAAHGAVDKTIVDAFLQQPFFRAPPPKSLDRYDFNSDAVKNLSLTDGAATLTAITAAAIAKACDVVPTRPKQLLITGGGRHNPTLMHMIEDYAKLEVAPVEAVGWNGDMLEAEAFAYLAARSVQDLPLSLPSTTRVTQPVTGGVFYPAARAAAS